MIYFDNSATTKPHNAVLDTFIRVASHYFANPSSLHSFGQKVYELGEEARKQVANLLGVAPKEIIFTASGTESNNLAIKGVAHSYQNRGKHIITSAVEHPSIIEPMQQLAKSGFEIDYLSVNESGCVSLEDVQKSVRKDTILVSLMHVNNEVGAIQPVAEIANWIKHNTKAFFHVDNVQGLAKVPLDLTHIDLMTGSGHKLHSINGTAFLMKKEHVQITPELAGGGQEMAMRSGTENTAGMVALAKALRLELINQQQESYFLYAIRNKLLDHLIKIPGITVHTDPECAAPHIICISVTGHQGEVLVHALEKEEIFVSTTSACSSKNKHTSSTLKAMKVSDNEAKGAIRISLSYQNTEQEVEIFIEKLTQILKNLNEVVK